MLENPKRRRQELNRERREVSSSEEVKSTSPHSRTSRHSTSQMPILIVRYDSRTLVKSLSCLMMYCDDDVVVQYRMYHTMVS